MNKETSDYLKKEFAYMFVDKTGQEPFTLFGFETHNGWNNLLFNLFVIINLLDTNKEIRVRQVKTKLGGLRFYIEWTGTINDKVYYNILDIIDLFENASYHICEECGKIGKEGNINNWLWTLCDECLNITLAEIKEKKETLLVSGHLQSEDI